MEVARLPDKRSAFAFAILLAQAGHSVVVRASDAFLARLEVLAEGVVPTVHAPDGGDVAHAPRKGSILLVPTRAAARTRLSGRFDVAIGLFATGPYSNKATVEEWIRETVVENKDSLALWYLGGRGWTREQVADRTRRLRERSMAATHGVWSPSPAADHQRILDQAANLTDWGHKPVETLHQRFVDLGANPEPALALQLPPELAIPEDELRKAAAIKLRDRQTAEEIESIRERWGVSGDMEPDDVLAIRYFDVLNGAGVAQRLHMAVSSAYATTLEDRDAGHHIERRVHPGYALATFRTLLDVVGLDLSGGLGGGQVEVGPGCYRRLARHLTDATAAGDTKLLDGLKSCWGSADPKPVVSRHAATQLLNTALKRLGLEFAAKPLRKQIDRERHHTYFFRLKREYVEMVKCIETAAAPANSGRSPVGVSTGLRPLVAQPGIFAPLEAAVAQHVLAEEAAEAERRRCAAENAERRKLNADNRAAIKAILTAPAFAGPQRAELTIDAAVSEIMKQLEESPDPVKRAQQRQANKLIADAVTSGGELVSMWEQPDPNTRYRCALSGVRGVLRGFVLPMDSRYVFINWDASSCHLMFAATESGDTELLTVALGGGYYEEVMAAHGVTRDQAKAAVNVMLNGGDQGTLVHKLSWDTTQAAAFRLGFDARFSVFSAWRDARALDAVERGTVTLPNGVEVRVERGRTKGASPIYMFREQQMLNNVLADVDGYARGEFGLNLAVPMHDGALMYCPRADADEAATWLQDTIQRHFPGKVKVGIGESWGEAEANGRTATTHGEV